MLFKTAFRNLKRNPIMNILTLLQLIAVLLIAGIMVSSLCIRYRLYLPFEDILESSGSYMTFAPYASTQYVGDDGFIYITPLNTIDELSDQLSAEYSLSVHSTYIYVGDGFVYDGSNDAAGEIYMPITLSYDDEIISRYRPALREGRWLSASSDEIELVISDNPYGWKTGDSVTFSVAVDIDKYVAIEARIVGMLEEGAEIFGMNRSADVAGDTYRLMYRPFYCEIEDTPLVLASFSALRELQPALWQPISSTVLTYGNGTDEEVMKNDRMVLAQYSSGLSRTLESMNVGSKAYLEEQLLQLLPIVIVLLILVLVSSVSVSALATRRRLRDYAKYYVVGLRWNQCVLVNLFQSLITSVAAMIISLAALVIVQYTALSEMFMVLWNGWLLLALAVIILLYLLFSMIMPVLMLRSVSPKQLLTSE